MGRFAAIGAATWWTPVRVLIVLGSLAWILGGVLDLPCMANSWASPDNYEHLCYSDIPPLYGGRGFADGYLPYLFSPERYRDSLAEVRRLSSALWTDHNTHDPGVTTLEVLCYAITDLAYRTDFATADLLAGQSSLLIRHLGEIYRLQTTRQGKLILTKLLAVTSL